MNKLNRFLFIFVAIFGMIVTACSSSDEPDDSSNVSFNVATTSVSFLKSGGSQSFYVQAASQPSVIADASWLHVESVALNGSSTTTYKVVLSADANPDNADRQTTVKVACGANSATVTATQIAKDGIVIESVSPDPSDLSYAATELTVNFLCNVDYTVTPADAWVSVEDPAGRSAMTEHQVVLKVNANGTKEARQTTVTFTAGDASATITVSQAPNNSNNMSSNAVELAKKIYAGFNIGNTMEATGGETAWGNPEITEKYIQGIKAAGFNAVRLPVAWDSHLADRSTYTIQESWLNRVSQVVGWCVANDLYVIVNIHWDGGWLEEHCLSGSQDEVNKEQKALWTQIANKLNSYDEHLLFAGCNEPNAKTADKMAVLKTYEQTFVDAVRATGGNNATRVLIVQGPDPNIDETNSLFGDMPTDVVADRLMVEVHYYDPWQFCGQTSDDGSFYFWGAGNHVSTSNRNASWGEEDYVATQFEKMQKQFVNKGIPVILGEYGALVDRSAYIIDAAQKAAHKQSRYDWNKVITREAKNHGMVPFLWDTGDGIDRTTGEIKSDVIVPAAIEGAGLGNYPF
jgi:aryl-phospho-beta-D-glucosidase BglC (GH1 family)